MESIDLIQQDLCLPVKARLIRQRTFFQALEQGDPVGRNVCLLITQSAVINGVAAPLPFRRIIDDAHDGLRRRLGVQLGDRDRAVDQFVVGKVRQLIQHRGQAV